MHYIGIGTMLCVISNTSVSPNTRFYNLYCIGCCCIQCCPDTSRSSAFGIQPKSFINIIPMQFYLNIPVIRNRTFYFGNSVAISADKSCRVAIIITFNISHTIICSVAFPISCWLVTPHLYRHPMFRCAPMV